MVACTSTPKQPDVLRDSKQDMCYDRNHSFCFSVPIRAIPAWLFIRQIPALHNALAMHASPLNPHLPSPIEFPPLHINPILLHSHAQILHRQNRPPLPTPTLPAPTKPTPLHPQLRSLLSTLATRATRRDTRLSWRSVTERVIAGCITLPRPGVLVCVCGDVCDEFLCGEGEETGEGEGCAVGGGACGI